MYRQQTIAVERNFLPIFTKNPYPEASIRLVDTIGEPDWSVQAMYGMYGEWMEKDGDRIIQPPLSVMKLMKMFQGTQLLSFNS